MSKSKCDILFWVDSDPNSYPPHSSGIARGECRTHGWTMTDQREVRDDMCPLGRIEDTLDKALEQIRKAMK